MDGALPRIIATREDSVRNLTWPSPAEANVWLDRAGFPPSFWRCATLADISRPGFCLDLIRKVKRCLHGRLRTDLRRQISEATRAREAHDVLEFTLLTDASILQKDTELYALHSLQLDNGMLTDAPTIFTIWSLITSRPGTRLQVRRWTGPSSSGTTRLFLRMRTPSLSPGT